MQPRAAMPVPERRWEKRQASRADAPILILGETGVGKGLLARVIHHSSPRAAGPFVAINCAAIPETLLEAELCGFERGAFTDARQAKPGLVEAAHRGTLLLDEVGLFPDALQAKLLDVLETGAVRRLGSIRSAPVDAWLMAATSTDLDAAVRAGRFRRDLYHRLAVLTFRLPPLRERDADVLLLADRFLAVVWTPEGSPAKRLSPEAREALRRYAWPGNIRELRNVIERVGLLSDEEVVSAAHLALPETSTRPPRGSSAPLRAKTGTAARDAGVGAEDDGARLARALRETGWNISHTAARLGMSRHTVRLGIEKYRLRRERPGESARGPAPPGHHAQQPPPPAHHVRRARARDGRGQEAPRHRPAAHADGSGRLWEDPARTRVGAHAALGVCGRRVARGDRCPERPGAGPPGGRVSPRRARRADPGTAGRPGHGPP
ncbi:MAG: sigma 54-interacting transcriptional regulator [Candidatus Rokubacteria bacterium]|nr:sigma 54-interacting transcriptional regulator [Candidatus Rokubacteria bacterium]